MINLLAIIVFVLGYLGITLEHNLKMNKAAFALLMGGLLWVIVAINVTVNGVPLPNVNEATNHQTEQGITANTFITTPREFITLELGHTASEIFEIIIFLLVAMSLVEILVHYKFFDLIRGRLHAWHFDDRKQLIVISILTFFLSAVVDNLTTTIVMIQIARQFFKNKNLLIVIVAIVICANAGGAFSPLGDVTTIMIWLQDKFTASEIILRGFLPSLSLAIVAVTMLFFKLDDSTPDTKNELVTKLTRSEKIIITLVFSSFLYPLLMNLINLPPYIGLLIGLGIVWIAIDLFKQISGTKTHLNASIEDLIRKIDLSSLKFFIGILLAVSALNTLGLLDVLSNYIYGSDHTNVTRIIWGNIFLGPVSAILDNVPLTAIVLNVLTTEATSLWILLAITIGTGGSLLVIGSAAGVIAMGMEKSLTFMKYLKIAFVPALSGYIVAVLVWYIQYSIFFS